MRTTQAQPGSFRGSAQLPWPADSSAGSGAVPSPRAEVGALRDLLWEPARRERDAVPSPGAVPEPLSPRRELEAWPSI